MSTESPPKSQPWSVPPDLWKGSTVAICASGQTMNTAVAEAALEHACIAVNDTYRIIPGIADMLVAHDLVWWQCHPEAIELYELRIGTQPGDVDILTLKSSGDEGFDDRPTRVRTGGNSGHTAVHIAAQAGARKIILCGFDMRPGRWHPEHLPPMHQTPPHAYAEWRGRLERLAFTLKQRGIEVVCGTESALQLPYEPII